MIDGISPVPLAARPYQGEPAGLVTRLAAATIDAGVVATAMVASYAGATAVLFLAHPRDFEPWDASLRTAATVGVVACVLYLAVAWTVTGRTYGDHVMGLRVVDRHGGPVGALRSLVRALLCVGFPIGLLWCVVGDTRRAFQDMGLGTSVIYDWTARHDTHRAGPLIHDG